MTPNERYLQAAAAYAKSRTPEVAQVHAIAMVADALLEVAAAIRETRSQGGAP